MGLEKISKETFGRIIKETRNNLKLSRKQVAVECGISEGYLDRIERGDQMPSDKLSERLAIKLKLDSTFIYLYSHLAGIQPRFRELFLKLQDYKSTGLFDK